MLATIAAWAASKFGGVAGKLVEFIIAILLLIVLVGGPYWLGMRHQRESDLAQQQSIQLAAAKQSIQQAAVGAQLAAKVEIGEAESKAVYAALNQEIPHVVTVYRRAPGAPLQPQPSCMLTRGFVGVWNRALVPTAAGNAAAPASAASAADSPSDVTRSDVLVNHLVNTQLLTSCQRQLNALIDWHEKLGEPR